MYDIRPLEEEWEKYRKKKRMPYILTGVFILFICTAFGLFYYMKGSGLLVLDHNQSKSKNNIEPVVLIEKPTLKKVETQQEQGQDVLETSDELIEDLPLPDEQAIPKKPKVKINIVTTETPMIEEKKPHKPVHLAITETSGSNAYKEVAARFRETQDTDDSLFLARTYYHKGSYKKAAYWALQTNNIDSSIEESILIFAKAKAKLKHRNEAIHILSKYINETNSLAAQNLLNKIKKGKI
jgi:hypothetical protein